MAVTKILKALAKARKTQADNIKKKEEKTLKKNPTTETERAAKKSVCGPGLGLKSTLAVSSIACVSYSIGCISTVGS